MSSSATTQQLADLSLAEGEHEEGKPLSTDYVEGREGLIEVGKNGVFLFFTLISAPPVFALWLNFLLPFVYFDIIIRLEHSSDWFLN